MNQLTNKTATLKNRVKNINVQNKPIKKNIHINLIIKKGVIYGQ